ncbi:probable GTP diphosphokinase CRSH, chloroplastic [Cryptomeria japonica]|uniref:probable GTP diphosphokinase CRSH, chloroplastic n=1 Tax=Cryptomeria japonica TaxID=3369 RepID=UPI0027D9DAC4|nr:probable GTP diphosphokinase CRSH, chloroplastic [Cryptomeria japonica]
MGVARFTAKNCAPTFPSILVSLHQRNTTRYFCSKSLNLQFHKLVWLKKCTRKAVNSEFYGVISCQTNIQYKYGLVKKHGDGDGDGLSLPGGKMVVELVAAWNDLTDRMTPAISSKSSKLLLKSLKISVSLLQSLPYGEDGRPPLTKALSVACILADLQVDAEVIAVGLLREVLEVSAIRRHEINIQLGSEVTHLLDECLRVKKIPKRVDILDENNASALRKFCLAYYDIRALIVELAIRLDMMRHSKHLPKYLQQTHALEVMHVYAPLAHAIGTGSLSLELEDLAFQYLFPNSYSFLDAWLRNHGIQGKTVLDEYRCQLFEVLQNDPELGNMVDGIYIQGRFKSRFSTMKKLLKDGRKQDEVYDVLGLRVVLNAKSGKDVQERGRKACYRARELIQSMWKEVPQRMKDYIAKPKDNGYESLHMTVDLSDTIVECPFMEIQIRTTEMDAAAVGGAASHELYKGGLIDPEQVKQLKAIMKAAADLAVLHFQDLPNGSPTHNDTRSQVFELFDKNEDGLISMEELKEIMEELGADKEDALELMQLVDANSDGSLSSVEFAEFQKQVGIFQNLEGMDEQCSRKLDRKFHCFQIDQSGSSPSLVENAECNSIAEKHVSLSSHINIQTDVCHKICSLQ